VNTMDLSSLERDSETLSVFSTLLAQELFQASNQLELSAHNSQLHRIENIFIEYRPQLCAKTGDDPFFVLASLCLLLNQVYKIDESDLMPTERCSFVEEMDQIAFPIVLGLLDGDLLKLNRENERTLEYVAKLFSVDMLANIRARSLLSDIELKTGLATRFLLEQRRTVKLRS